MSACRGKKSLLLGVACVVGLASWAGAARAQDVALAGRGPRFLQSASVSAAPVEIEAASSAVLRRLVSLSVTEPTAGKLLGAIERQTGLTFAYNLARLPADRRVDLEAQRITVAAALTVILLDTGLDVLLTAGDHVVFVERAASPPRTAANGAVAGRVTDAKTQVPIAGATVVIDGIRRGATTGNDGRYRIADVAPGTYPVRARYIGYAPGTASVTVSEGQEATADFTLEKSAQRLDEVVTTGTVVPTEVKALPTPVSVLTGDEIREKGYQRVDQVFRGDVPGAVAWDEGADDYYSAISVRGGSTLSGASTLKTFIDGVEVASPLFIATIDPTSIDRIEVTRGPQASTLYGAGALSGVLQIFTKKGQPGLTRPEVTGKLSAGGIGGFEGTAFQTDNALSVQGGGGKTTYSIGGSYRHVGDWAPFYNSNDWGVSAGGQTTQGPFTLSGSARYADKIFDSPWYTRLQSYLPYSKPPYFTNQLRQQTYGVTASLQATRTWQHSLTLGYDQIYFDDYNTQPQFTTPADSFRSVFANHEAKTSLLYHTDLNIGVATSVSAILTAGVNYDAYDDVNTYTYNATRTTGSLDGTSLVSRTSWTNTGYFGQVQVDLGERLFLTGGLRAERNPDFGAAFGTAWSPRVGAAYVVALGPARAKLRASYGESIRAPDPTQRNPAPFPGFVYLDNPNLGPERQRGGDGGVEVYLGRASLGVTYYNQRAIGLIQQVTIPTPPGTLPTSQYQNVGRVKNEGWEFEGHLPVGSVQLAGTFSVTNSTVQELGPGYPAGQYRVGDRLNGVPRTSAGVTVTYSPFRTTSLTASMTYIGHWTETDYLTLYGFYYGGQPYRGSDRAYWIEYPSVTKFAVGMSQQLAKQVTGFVRVQNIGNSLRAEQYNINLPKPRSVEVGANVRY